jgi:hypothetical protein
LEVRGSDGGRRISRYAEHHEYLICRGEDGEDGIAHMAVRHQANMHRST